MQFRVFVATMAGLCFGASAQASIAMSFADPLGGRQLYNQANGESPGVSVLSYDADAPLAFLFDGAEDGLPSHVFENARMEMRLTLGTAFTFAGVTVAPVAGSFTILDGNSLVRSEILVGVAKTGSFVRISGTNAILFSGPSFGYMPGDALLALTGPLGFVDPSEAVFTLTGLAVEGDGPLINADGSFNSFDANASFTGNVERGIPAPGMLAIVGLGALRAARRRRA